MWAAGEVVNGEPLRLEVPASPAASPPPSADDVEGPWYQELTVVTDGPPLPPMGHLADVPEELDVSFVPVARGRRVAWSLGRFSCAFYGAMCTLLLDEGHLRKTVRESGRGGCAPPRTGNQSVASA